MSSLSCLSIVKRRVHSTKRPPVPNSHPKSVVRGNCENMPLSLDDVRNFFINLYEEIYKNNPDIDLSMRASATELGNATAEQGFINVGIGFEGCMTWNDWKMLLDADGISHTQGAIEVGGKFHSPISSVIFESEYPLWGGEYDDEGHLCGGNYHPFRYGMSREEYVGYSETKEGVKLENEGSSDFDDLEFDEGSDDSYYEPSTPPRRTNVDKTGPPDIKSEYRRAKSFKRGVGRFVLLGRGDDGMESSDDEWSLSDNETEDTLVDEVDESVVGVKEYRDSIGYDERYEFYEGDTGAGILYCAGIGSPR